MSPDPLVTAEVPVHDPPAHGRFELRGRVGAGNHGVVFRARDHQLQRDVAIKRFSHFLADDPRAMRRIEREVALLARVQHPHVVTVHDLVQMRDGDGEVTPHLVMELVEGTSLRDLLATHGPSLRSVVLVRGVLEGLAACHAADILHLDIKPANVLVTPGGAVKIVDFGIARAASDSTATLAGTPHYMAPEQYEGRADERSDIYSVGCLLYETLTGRAPFAGSMAAQLMAHRTEPRPDPRAVAPEVGAGLAAVVMRAMAVDPAQRYPTVHAMLAALDVAASAPARVPGSAVDDEDTERVPRIAPPTAHRPGGATPRVDAVPEGPLVTRWTRLGSYGAGLALSAFVVALLPGLVWATLAVPPAADFRPTAMSEADGPGWWMLAVALAGLHLLARRETYFRHLGGPAVGTRRPDRTVHDGTRAGVRLAAGGALRGSLPMLFPWYAAAVAVVAASAGIAWPPGVLETGWGVAWVLMPLAAVVLTLRGVTRVRFRLGSLFVATLHLAAAVLATALFLLYPTAL